jgi:hypothetical protein
MLVEEKDDAKVALVAKVRGMVKLCFANLAIPDIDRVEFYFQDEVTLGSRAIPYGCKGALLNYAFGTEKITDYALLKESRLMTDPSLYSATAPGCGRSVSDSRFSSTGAVTIGLRGGGGRASPYKKFIIVDI